jgi:ribosomal protein L29
MATKKPKKPKTREELEAEIEELKKELRRYRSDE